MDLDLYAAIGILLLISALFTIGGNYILNNNNYNKFFKTSTVVDVQHILNKNDFYIKMFHKFKVEQVLLFGQILFKLYL